jgi:nucleoside-diphosphate-sugar epimerase
VNILLTGSSGRIGRAIYGALSEHHDIIGLDRTPFATTRVVADFCHVPALRTAMDGVDAIVHTASLHAPHVGLISESEFHRINVEGLRTLVAVAKASGVGRLVYTSTTALYGDAVVPGACTWIDESTVPKPKTVYHRTKLQAEALLEAEAGKEFEVTIIRMSRCFPERADLMAFYRLFRGIDVRDVGDVHAAALVRTGPHFRRYIASGGTPFVREDVQGLAQAADEVFVRRAPRLAEEFVRRGWTIPGKVDRVYDARAAFDEMGWRARHGPLEVMRQHDAKDLEVLPVIKH